MVAPDEPVHLLAAPEPFVSRAGRKLNAALDVFDVDITGKTAIDVGASTGGFTDCLLQRDVESVVALDVGYGQLHWKIRQDERVTTIERTNVRTVDPAAIGAPFDIVVGDLSFISLGMLAPQLVALGTDQTDWILLIKPQFEVGKDQVGKGGIVRDRETRERAIRSVATAFNVEGATTVGLVRSPITGTTGNVEYLAWFRRDMAPQDVEILIHRLPGDDQ